MQSSWQVKTAQFSGIKSTNDNNDKNLLRHTPNCFEGAELIAANLKSARAFWISW